MDLFDIILFGLFEIVGLIAIVRLWTRRGEKLLARFLWSVALLVPFFGLIAYAVLHEDPEGHPYCSDSTWSGYGGDPGGGHGGHGGGGH
jgi:hypothetical protein